MKQEYTLIKKKKSLDLREMLNIRLLSGRAIEIFKKHIGEDKKISKREFFIKLFNTTPEEVSELYLIVMNELIKKTLHLLRASTKCQVICKAFKASRFSTEARLYYYWVASTYNDFAIYRDNLENTVRNIRKAENRMEKSIKERWYNYPSEWKI